MKTISMRLRGYDEETETYSDDLKEITGDIANLTKVASNNNQGISLFEADDPNTYRSTYAMLKKKQNRLLRKTSKRSMTLLTLQTISVNN